VVRQDDIYMLLTAELFIRLVNKSGRVTLATKADNSYYNLTIHSRGSLSILSICRLILHQQCYVDCTKKHTTEAALCDICDGSLLQFTYTPAGGVSCYFDR